MHKQTQKSILKYGKYILLFLTLFLLTGCSIKRVADDLLVQVETSKTLVSSKYLVETSINKKINNSEKIDNSVKESIKIALDKANIFSKISENYYTIYAHIDTASQATMSFGNFEGTLMIKYTVFDEKNNLVLEENIFTIAGSDRFIFSGAERHARARAVNIAKNVLQFTEILRVFFENK